MSKNRTSASAAQASSRKVELADRGPRGNMRGKLQMVEDYLIALAAETGKAVADVPCPDRNAWAKLSSGRRPTLPNESQLALYANDRMRQVAVQYGGNLRQAYFEVARCLVLRRG